MDRILKLPKKDKITHPIQEHQYIYIMGKPGIGKTYTVKRVYPDIIELTSDVLKSKQSTIDFIERVRCSNLPVLIDDYDSVEDNIGLREITGPITSKPLVVIGNKPHSLEGKPFVYNFPVMSIPDIMKLASGANVERKAIFCQGDLRRFFQSLLFDSDDPDVFMSPKQVIESIIGTNGTENPFNLLGNYMEEHGNMMGLIQENYPKSPIASFVEVTQCLSNADLIDQRLYNGDWHLMPFFFVEAVITPAMSIGHTINEIGTASMWTKELNMKMREKKIRNFSNKVTGLRLDHDEIVLLGRYVNNDIERAKELVSEYRLESADIDVMNHLHKLKTRNSTIIKKECREQMNQPKKNKSLKS